MRKERGSLGESDGVSVFSFSKARGKEEVTVMATERQWPRAVKGTSVSSGSAMCTALECVSDKLYLPTKFGLLRVLKGKIRGLGMPLESRVEFRWRCVDILKEREEQLHRLLKIFPARIPRA